MKYLLLLCLFLSSLASASTLEKFFSGLEGSWTLNSAESHRETPAGEITSSVASFFSAQVSRKENSWNFVEKICWTRAGVGPECLEAALAYEVIGEELVLHSEGKSYPVDVLECDENFLLFVLSLDDATTTAVLSRDGATLEQNTVTELVQGDKVYELLNLRKQ